MGGVRGPAIVLATIGTYTWSATRVMIVAKLVPHVRKRLADDSLSRNSLYLMGSTFVVAASGFLYWILAAHLYSGRAVGLAATLISVSNVVLVLSMMGYDNSFIRFLPKAKDQHALIDTGFTVAIIATAIVSLVYVAVIYLFVPSLSVVLSSLVWVIFFVFFMMVSTLNFLSNYPFIAHRITYAILVVNAAMGILRLVLLFLFTDWGLDGLLLSYVLALTFALVATLYYMKLKMNYVFHFRIDWRGVKKMWGYSSSSYASIIFLTLPAYILPMLVIEHLGAASSAYYYIVAVIIAALNVIPQATAQSLLAEGVWNQAEIKQHFFKAGKIVALLTVPAIVLLIVGGRVILSMFGKGYAEFGYMLLVLLSVSGLCKAGSYLLSAVLRMDHQVGRVAGIYAVYATIILTGSYIGLQGGHGLLAIGLSTLLAEAITVILFGIAYQRYMLRNRQRTKQPAG